MTDDTLWRPLYPFGSHFFHLSHPTAGSARTLKYHYVDEGDGEVLLMVHGNPTWSFYWRNLILGLRDEFRTIAPDHIGCGLSDKPQVYRYTLSQHAQNLVDFIQGLNLDRITLVVHDWGGPIGLAAALQLPERIRRLILFNTGAFPPPFIPKRIAVCRTPLLGTLALRGLNLFSRAALWMAVADRQRMTPQVSAGLLAPYDSWAHRVAVARFVQDIPRDGRHPTWQALAEIERRLPELADRPVQMIWGMQDWCFTPACLDRLTGSFPEAEVHRLHDAGHYIIEDAHERIVPLVREFLQRRKI